MVWDGPISGKVYFQGAFRKRGYPYLKLEDQSESQD